MSGTPDVNLQQNQQDVSDHYSSYHELGFRYSFVQTPFSKLNKFVNNFKELSYCNTFQPS